MYAIEPSPAQRSLTQGTDKVREFQWVLEKFQTDLPGVFDVALVSADGLLLARASAPKAPAPGLVSPITSGLAALAGAASQLHESGAVHRTVLEMQHSTLVVVTVSDGSLLAVAADSGTDRAVLGYQMTRLVRRVGHVLTSELRSTLRDHAAAAC
ncbi:MULTISPECIES: roadblock/LC7 domain-containing protein [unclassified Streptomyces]|uniref:roadblock/LC7 domain-containing protein n=1 Tax=unclassified Streptomyces TaxID=2593676 RepID=UPI003824B26A